MRTGRNKNCLFTLFLFFTLIFAACSSDPPPAGKNRLVKDRLVTESVVSDEVHSYTVPLEKGQYLELKIEQNDVDVIAEALTPAGDSLGEFDTPTSGRGTETVRIGAADEAGEYRINIYTLSENAEPGTYTLKLAELRDLTDRDAKLLRAVRLHQQADKLRAEQETRAASIPVYKRALEIWRETGERAEEGNTLRALGFAYQRMDDPEKALEYFGRALEIWREIGDHRSAAFAHIIFGVIAKKQGDLKKGLEYDLQAQTLWERAGDMPEYTRNLVRIGGDYVRLKDREKAFEYFERALEKSRGLGSRTLQAYVLGSYAEARAAFGEKKEAEKLYRRSIDLWKAAGREKVAESYREKLDKLKG